MRFRYRERCVELFILLCFTCSLCCFVGKYGMGINGGIFERLTVLVFF